MLSAIELKQGLFKFDLCIIVEVFEIFCLLIVEILFNKYDKAMEICGCEYLRCAVGNDFQYSTVNSSSAASLSQRALAQLRSRQRTRKSEYAVQASSESSRRLPGVGK